MVLPIIAVPWILGGLSAAAGALGIKKGISAKANYEKAKNVVAQAQQRFRSAQDELEDRKHKAGESLAALGALRIKTEAEHMRRYVDVVSAINRTHYKKISLDDTGPSIDLPKLREIATSSYKAVDLLKDGIGAISSGVLVGVGASGLASSIGVVASTGTAIGSLSGIAATNATLAWLGGGSLAAGGMGMAGGTAILGGVVAGPVLAVIGYAAASRSETALTEAFSKESEILGAVEQIENGKAVLIAIEGRSEELQQMITRISSHFDGLLARSETLVLTKKNLQVETDRKWRDASPLARLFRWFTRAKPHAHLEFKNFSPEDKETYSTLNLFGMALYQLIKVKVLDDQGLVTAESAEVAAKSQSLLQGG